MTGYFAVRNYETFQHYKDRNPPWIKLYNSLLDSYEYAQLPDATKAHLLAIYLLASRTNNKIPADFAWIKASIKAHEEVDLLTLVKYDFIVPDQQCSEMLALCGQVAPQSRGEGEGESKSSVSYETDVPSDPIKVFFDSGLALFGELNPSVSEKAVRGLLGKLRQKFPEIADAQDALDIMAAQRPVDPVAWLMAFSRSELPPLRHLADTEPLDPEFYQIAAERDSEDAHADWEDFRNWHVAKGVGFRSMFAEARRWFDQQARFRRSKIYAVK